MFFSKQNLNFWISTFSSLGSRLPRNMSKYGTIPSVSRPRAVDVNELYRYSSGRWLVNESQQLAQRYIRFNIEELCRVAASVVGPSTVCNRIDKIEGNFNKALLMTMDNGREVVAKLPCSNAGPAYYTTASEVATLEFVRSRTPIRVPRVLAWEPESTNPVGAEYIILEKVPGVALGNKWDDINDVDRYKLIEHIVDMEKHLSDIHFPAYGNLYFRQSIANECRVPLDSALDPSGIFCVGPPCGRSWFNARSSGDLRKRGPWAALSDFVMAKTWQAISRTRHEDAFEKSCESREEYIRLLHRTEGLIPTLAAHPMITRSSASVLWHPDLNLGNIIVSPEDPTVVEGIIDWQSSTLAPLFLQCRVPVFLEPPKDYAKGAKAPELPENYDQLDEIQQWQAKQEMGRATRWKIYEMNTLIKNLEVYNALGVDRRLWEPLSRCGQSFDDNTVPLRSSLIRVCNDWSLLQLPSECPFAFSKSELDEHREDALKYQDRIYLQARVKDRLGTDDDGWIPIHEWESAKSENERLLKEFVETMSGEMREEEAKTMWPFCENPS